MMVDSDTGSMPAAIFQDQQVQQACSGPQSDSLADDGDLPHQEIQAPGPQGSRSDAAYSYKLLPLQPLIDSDWSRRSYPNMLQINQDREAPSHGQYAVKRRMYPLFPTPPDPPYVVCQHCLQLLVLPLTFPPLTRSTQKLRCSGCMCISVFSAEPTVGRSATIGDLPGVTCENDSRKFSAGQPSQHSVSIQKLSSSVGRNFPVHSAPEAMLTSSFAASAFECTGVGRSNLNTEVSINPLQPVPLPSPLSYAASGASTSASIYATAPKKGKDILEEFGGSFEKSTSDQGQELQELQKGPGPISSVYAGSECESDSARNGLTLGNLAEHPLPDDNSGSIDEYESSSSYPPSSTKDQEGPKGRNKVVNMIKGLKELTKTGQGKIYRRQVYVNSRAIPDPLVKKAEENAGPIHPGQYWYDVHAGFWGVMGGPCKGIVPPFIEELNYPLPRDCSGGKTGVVVNGRELHIQDLEKLSRRGLPTTPGISYRVEIDGRVTEENSGQELKSLGRLAPSVVKRGRGHGMVVEESMNVFT